METIKVIEKDGIYTVYRVTIKRTTEGKLFESVSELRIPLPDPNASLPHWARSLHDDELEVSMQVFYDRWNFGSGNKRDHIVYSVLYDERQDRIEKKREYKDIVHDVINKEVQLGTSGRGSGQKKYKHTNCRRKN